MSRSLPAYDEPRPDPHRSGYVSTTHHIDIDATRARIRALDDDTERPLSEIIDFDQSAFPAVVAEDELSGDWTPGRRVGARRRVRFADGSCLAEEVLIDDPEHFQYMIWGFTHAQRFAVAQGLAEFRWQEHSTHTTVIWTYSLLPRLRLLRPFVRRFLRTVMDPMMTATLAGMKTRAESA